MTIQIKTETLRYFFFIKQKKNFNFKILNSFLVCLELFWFLPNKRIQLLGTKKETKFYSNVFFLTWFR